MKYISLVLSSLLFVSCTSKEVYSPLVKQTQETESIRDLSVVPQDISYYTKAITPSPLTTTQESYEKQYFNVWNLDKIDISVKDAMWAHNSYSEKNSYGENLQVRKASFFKDLLENANYKEYATLNANAITLQRVNLRAMPSDKPVLLNPKKAGEGFPFDYLQNSAIAANKPLLISHYSKDKEWVFVRASFAYGWVKSRDIVTLEKKHTAIWQKAEQVFLTKDSISLYSTEGKFLFKSQIGMMFALVAEDESSYTVLAVDKYKSEEALFVKLKLSKELSHKGKLDFTAENIDTIIRELSKSKYGWGGMYGERDCSSTIRDFYAPFGLWLPRNSYKQSLSGEVIPLDGFSLDEKLATIKKSATAFKTLIYKRGHIGLYVGTFNDKVIFYQNIWGVKTLKNEKEGRFIIGRPIFSTLEVGSNLQYFDKNSSMLTKLKSMTKL